MNEFDNRGKVLTRELIRQTLCSGIRGRRWGSLFAGLFAIPFFVFGYRAVSRGEAMGVLFFILPALIAGIGIFLMQRRASLLAGQLELFEQGSFELKRMLLEALDKKESTDSDGASRRTYYVILREEDGPGSARFTVGWKEYSRASIGELYYVLFVRGAAVLPFAAKNYTPDAELQAMLCGRAALTDCAPTESDSFSGAEDGTNTLTYWE